MFLCSHSFSKTCKPQFLCITFRQFYGLLCFLLDESFYSATKPLSGTSVLLFIIDASLSHESHIRTVCKSISHEFFSQDESLPVWFCHQKAHVCFCVVLDYCNSLIPLTAYRRTSKGWESCRSWMNHRLWYTLSTSSPGCQSEVVFSTNGHTGLPFSWRPRPIIPVSLWCLTTQVGLWSAALSSAPHISLGKVDRCSSSPPRPHRLEFSAPVLFELSVLEAFKSGLTNHFHNELGFFIFINTLRSLFSTVSFALLPLVWLIVRSFVVFLVQCIELKEPDSTDSMVIIIMEVFC